MLHNYSARSSNPFVGREKELADVVARLQDPACRLLTLTGLGGSGKTRLAIEAAHAAAAAFPHGVVLVELQPLTRVDLLAPAIAQALGVTFYGEDASYQQLLEYVRDKQLLLVLDDFEHLLDGVGLVSTLLREAAGLKLLATSREALNVQDEWLYPLKGLATPPSIYSTSWQEYEAVQLFLYHARRAQPAFDPASEYESIFQICHMTAGLPLAIALAASWLKGLSAVQVAQAMQRNLDILSTTARDVEPRHRSMRAVFDQSWALLPANEQLMFARLAVFAGGFSSSAAEQIAGASLADLAALVEKSLVQLDTADRFNIHAMLRQYGMERLSDYHEVEATYDRHSRYFADMVQQQEAALKQPQQLTILQAIDRDFDNIRLAWEWSIAHQQLAQLQTMLNGLYLFGFLGSRHRETILLLQQTLEQPITDTRLLGRLLVRRWGFLHWWYQADYHEALTSIERALAIAQQADDRFETAFCHLMAAYALISMQRNRDAVPHLEESYALFEALGDPYYLCWVLHRLAYVFFELQDAPRAYHYTEQSLALAQATGSRFSLVNCLHAVGSVCLLTGDYPNGRHCGEQELQSANESSHPCQVAHALSLLALHAFCQGDYEACQAYAERSQSCIKEIISIVLQPYSLSLLILLACRREEYAEAIRLTELAQRLSNHAIGRQLYYWASAALACGLGKPAEARSYVEKMLQLAGKDANAATTTWVVPCVAISIAETDREMAVALTAWVTSHPDTALNWARQWPLFIRFQSELQDRMTPDVYVAAWQRGTALTAAAVAAYMQHTFQPSIPALDGNVSPALLTSREAEILGLIAIGMSNPQIAARLVIGVGTVKTHTLHIYRKLDVASRTQAIHRAQELGLL